MSPQLTLQTPLELAPAEVPHYLEQLWSPEQPVSYTHLTLPTILLV